MTLSAHPTDFRRSAIAPPVLIDGPREFSSGAKRSSPESIRLKPNLFQNEHPGDDEKMAHVLFRCFLSALEEIGLRQGEVAQEHGTT